MIDDLIYDVGMHNGADTDFYLQWLCSFHICSWPIALAKAGTTSPAAPSRMVSEAPAFSRLAANAASE